MVTQLVLRPLVIPLVWLCRCTPPVQLAGHERFNVVPPAPEVVTVIVGWDEAVVTVTDPSTPRLFWTVKPGETIVMLVTGWLKMVNVSPTWRMGPPLISVKVPPLV